MRNSPWSNSRFAQQLAALEIIFSRRAPDIWSLNLSQYSINLASLFSGRRLRGKLDACSLRNATSQTKEGDKRRTLNPGLPQNNLRRGAYLMSKSIKYLEFLFFYLP